jgi:hypothetical protein
MDGVQRRYEFSPHPRTLVRSSPLSRDLAHEAMEADAACAEGRIALVKNLFHINKGKIEKRLDRCLNAVAFKERGEQFAKLRVCLLEQKNGNSIGGQQRGINDQVFRAGRFAASSRTRPKVPQTVR